jgi:amidohydrolase
VRFVFQPAEEEEGGGKELIEKGLLDAEPRAEAAFALHGWIGLPAGRVSGAPGTVMAAADRFAIVIRGRGGHAALPHRAADPVVTAAQVIVGLQSIVSRSVDPLEPSVLSVCSIQGGSASNVIPDEVVLEGTTRYFDDGLRTLLAERMAAVLEGTCAAGGCAHTLRYTEGYPPLENDPRAVALARSAVCRYVGAGAWDDDHPRTMGSEDFSFYLKRVPGALLRLGLGKGWPALHSPEFDFNDEALEAGILTLAGLAIDFCSGRGMGAAPHGQEREGGETA